MRKTKSAITVFVAYSLSMAAISGTVFDTAGNVVHGAMVRLEKEGLSDITNNEGEFLLEHVVSARHRARKSSPRLSAAIRNGVMRLHTAEGSTVQIEVFDLRGKTLAQRHFRVKSGTHAVAIPYQGKGAHIYRIAACGSVIFVKCGPRSGISKKTSGNALHFSAAHKKAEQVGSAEAIDDVIAVSSEGFLHYRVIVTNSDTSGIEIILLSCADTLIDIQGNIYQAVQFGNRIWTVEDFRATRFNDSVEIPNVTKQFPWAQCTTAAYCYYNDKIDTTMYKQGVLYNWYAISSANFAPRGWRDRKSVV
jgi:hypothetical protein